LAAAFTVAGIFLTFWGSSVRARHSDLATLSARASAEQAHQKATENELENSKLKIEIERQKAKHAELAAKAGPRHLSPDQQKTLSVKLSGHDLSGSTVHFELKGGDEAKEFAQNIADILKRLGVNSFSASIAMNQIVMGADTTRTQVLVAHGKAAAILGDAFRALGSSFEVRDFMSKEEYEAELAKPRGLGFALDPKHSLIITINQKPAF